MKEHPILFAGEMVRAIRAGRKTQTRRVIKPQPIWKEFKGTKIPLNPGFLDYARVLHRCPFGVPGDKLTVRETWAVSRDDCDLRPRELTRDDPTTCTGRRVVYYRANGSMSISHLSEYRGKWRPSTNMPRWACRLVLDVTDVRVERASEDGVDDGGKSYAAGCWLWVPSFDAETPGR